MEMLLKTTGLSLLHAIRSALRLFIMFFFASITMFIAVSCSDQDAGYITAPATRAAAELDQADPILGPQQAATEMSQKEFDVIQRYYNMRPEYVAIDRLKRKRTEELIPELYTVNPTSEAVQEKYQPILAKIDKEFLPFYEKLNAKYGMSVEQYIEIGMGLVQNSAKVDIFKGKGGQIPRVRSGNSPDRSTYAERLVNANIIIDLSNPDSIIDALGKAGSIVQLDTIKALGDTEDKDAVQYLSGFLDNDSVLLQIASAESLCKLGNSDGADTLVAVVGDTEASELFRLSAINAMKFCAENEAINHVLVEVLRNDGNKNIRLLAAIEFQKRAEIGHLNTLVEINKNEAFNPVHATNDKTIRNLQHEEKMQEYLGQAR